MKTKKICSKKAFVAVLVFFWFNSKSFAQDVILKAKIQEKDVPSIILEDVAEDYGDYQLYDTFAVPVDFVEDDIIVETSNKDISSYGSYELKLKKGNDVLTVFYNKDGKLIYSTEKGKNVAVPPVVRNAVAKEYPGWAFTKSLYKMKHQNGDKPTIRYKIYLTKNRNTIKVYVDEKGKLL